MDTLRKDDSSAAPQQNVPAPADYRDEITDEQIQKLRELVAAEFADDQPELVKGPAW